MNRPGPARPSRHGKIMEGWQKLGMQVPDNVRDDWFKATPGHSHVKMLGTAAVSLVCAMPEEIRFDLLKFVHSSTFPEPTALKPEDVWARLLELIEQHKA